eukprot:678961-Rhodomonas_salina.3
MRCVVLTGAAVLTRQENLGVAFEESVFMRGENKGGHSCPLLEPAWLVNSVIKYVGVLMWGCDTECVPYGVTDARVLDWELSVSSYLWRAVLKRAYDAQARCCFGICLSTEVLMRGGLGLGSS